MKGRKPKPAALKVLSGTDQPSRMPAQVKSPATIQKAPPPPRWFSKLAKRIYKDTSTYLLAQKVLTEVDIEMLVAYSHEYAQYLEISEMFANGTEKRVIIVETKKGRMHQVNPMIKIAQASLEKSKSIGVEFGLTPSSRSRVSPIKQEQVDPFVEYLSRRA